jgi:hypothetical protein
VRLLESSKVDEYADVMKDIKSKCKTTTLTGKGKTEAH